MEMNRREFFKLGTGSLVFALTVPVGSKRAIAGSPKFANHYFEVTADNQFHFIMDKAEMGQGVVTGQTTLFGEEADIEPGSMRVRSAGVDSVYGTLAGQQVTGGSTSTPDRWLVLRQAGANVRALMIKAAAQKLQVPVADLRTENGVVLAKNGESATYGSLIELASQMRLDEDASLKSKADFRYIGQRKYAGVDAEDKSTGRAQFGMDFEKEGLLTAVIVRCPVFGGEVKSFNAEGVKGQPGVVDVFEVFSGVAIVCEKYWQANRVRNLLEVEWDLGDNANVSSTEIMANYRKAMNEGSGSGVHAEGDVDSAFDEADEVVEAEYQLPYLAHACMEPMNCAAEVREDSCDIWSPNQAPTLIRNEAARRLGMSRDDVKVHTTKYLGGGFGRRSTLEYSMEAVEVSKKLKKPVKVVWSREDDTRYSPMRPISLHKFRGAIKGGKVTAWEHKLGCESIMQQVMPEWIPLMLPGWMPGFLGRGVGSLAGGLMSSMNFSPTTAEGAEIPYAVPNRSIRHYSLDLDIPIHFWRSVGHSYNGFIVESFIDELAIKMKKDPYEFRRELMQEDHRQRRVLDEVAKMAGWKTTSLPQGRFRGIASHFSFNSYVGQVAEVEIENDQIQVKKVYCAVDCGIAVNPVIIEKQMESGIIYGLSAALHGNITLKDGQVEQGNFDTYPPLRMSETPEIEVKIIDSDEAPTGVGEPGLPAIGAAVANAVYQATGQRVRTLPMGISLRDA